MNCSTSTSGIVTTILLPLFGVFMFYDSKKRKAAAEARKAEADNITSYAAEWKELYEKKEHRVVELDSKMNQLYAEKNEDRQRIRELTEKNATLEIEDKSWKQSGAMSGDVAGGSHRAIINSWEGRCFATAPFTF